MSLKKIDTPCIGICSTIYGDTICRGCKRSYQEVIDWNTYNNATKAKILQVLWQHIVLECRDKINVINQALLAEQCEKYNIRFSKEQDPLCWAFYLLREGHSKINQLEKYGIEILPAYSQLSLTALYHLIDDQLLNKRNPIPSQ
jgi:predicted Fe-S protein YdhL (DUF1289 family)